MKLRKALLSEEDLSVMKERDKVSKAIRELLKHVRILCTGKNRTEHI